MLCSFPPLTSALCPVHTSEQGPGCKDLVYKSQRCLEVLLLIVSCACNGLCTHTIALSRSALANFCRAVALEGEGAIPYGEVFAVCPWSHAVVEVAFKERQVVPCECPQALNGVAPWCVHSVLSCAHYVRHTRLEMSRPCFS